MSSLPSLPVHPVNAPWSSNLYHAHQIISDIYRSASDVLLQEADAIRLKLHTERLTSDVIPILLELERTTRNEGLPIDWLHSCTEHVGVLVAKLCEANERISLQYVGYEFSNHFLNVFHIVTSQTLAMWSQLLLFRLENEVDHASL